MTMIPAWVYILIALLNHDGCAVGQIRKVLKLRISSGTFFKHLSFLEENGLVRRERSTHKIVHVYLTDRGKEVAEVLKSVFFQ